MSLSNTAIAEGTAPWATALHPVDQVSLAYQGLAQHPSGQTPANVQTLTTKVSDSTPETLELSLIPAQDISQALAPETLKKFRRGYGEEAAQVAQKLKGIAVTSAEGVLRQANLLSKLKERLNRKEWGVWQKEVLGWFGKEAEPYLQIAKAFSKFAPTVFRNLEPFTLLKLRTKRYAPLVERLQEEINITSEMIQNLIAEVIPTPSKRKKAAPNYDEAVLKQRLNGEDGTFYFTLHANLGDQPGEWLQSKLEDRTLGQVLEHAKSLEKQAEERRDDMKEGIEAQIEQRVRNLVEMASFSLKQEIADLRAQLKATTAKASAVGERAIALTNITDEGASDEGRAVTANAIAGELAIANTNVTDDEGAAEARAISANAIVGEQAIANTNVTDDEGAAEERASGANAIVGERAIATTNVTDDEGAAEARAVSPNAIVGERAIANTNVTDDEGAVEARAVGANAIVGEQALATTDTHDDEVLASALIEPVSAIVGEQALATSNVLNDKVSAEPLTEPGALRAQALEPEEPEPTEETSDASTNQSPEQEAMSEPNAALRVQEEASSPSIEPTTAAPQEEEAATSSVEATSLTEADSKLRAAQEQEITPPWKQLSQLREAEKYIQEIDSHINKFNSDLSQPRLDRIVGNQIKDALKNRQKLRSTKVGQITAVADASGIVADYEALRNSGRVVLAPSYASCLLRQCDSWSEVEMVVGRERDQLLRAVKEWGVEEKQLLVRLLSSHLETEANPLEQIDWIPNKLVSKALSNFTFRLQRIKDSDNLVDDAEMEYLEGCKFVSVQNLGDRQEQWVFEFKSKNIPMFDREQIAIEKF